MVVEHSVTEVVLFCVLIIVCLWCDLHAHQADKPVSARNAAIWSCIWVGLALVYPGLCVRVSARPRVRVYADMVNELRECQHEGSLPLGRVASQRDAAAGQAHDLS